MKKRQTARVMVFDPVGRVLLIRFVIERSSGTLIFWLTPGAPDGLLVFAPFRTARPTGVNTLVIAST